MHTNNKYFFLLFIFCGLTIFIATAETIDGSSGVSYQTNHYVFNDASLPHQVTGFVRFTNGFTVTPQASASSILNFNGNVLVSGAIDLRETSTLNLQRSMYLESTVTLSSGGHIYGNGNAIN